FIKVYNQQLHSRKQIKKKPAHDTKKAQSNPTKRHPAKTSNINYNKKRNSKSAYKKKNYQINNN
ncbi:hypothetical protein, partial [Klebsiella pneumoniae]|uniref:hypothetical protein n=1 Tax=Klebsiella pneumoniae TaxID=573 RepID=UPI0039C30BE8